MSPAFGAPESRALFPIFNRSAEAVSVVPNPLSADFNLGWSQITLRWKDLLFCSPTGTVALDVSDWLSRATLDAIGEGERPMSCHGCVLRS